MITQVKVPDLGDLASSATVVAWHVEKNAMVNEGDLLCSVETKKASVDVESPQTGIITEIFSMVGDEVSIEDIIANIETIDENSDLENTESDTDKDTLTTDLFASTSTEETPQTPLETLIAEKKKIEDIPKAVEPIPVEPIPVEKIPVEKIPVEPIPVEKIPVEKIPVEKIPVEKIPVEKIPVEKIPSEPIPVEKIPVEPIPVEPIPVEPIPVEQTSVEPIKEDSQTVVEEFLSSKPVKPVKKQSTLEKFLASNPLEDTPPDSVFDTLESEIFGNNTYKGDEVPLQEVVYEEETQKFNTPPRESKPTDNLNDKNTSTPLPVHSSKLPIVKIPDQHSNFKLPIVEIPMSNTADDVPLSEPVIEIPMVDTVDEVAVSEPVIKIPMVDTVDDVPLSEPVIEIPMVDTVDDVPLSEPVIEIPMVDTVDDVPLSEPVIENPVVEGVSQGEGFLISDFKSKLDVKELKKSGFLLNPEEIMLSSSPDVSEQAVDSKDNQSVSYLFDKIRESSLINDENKILDTEKLINKHSHISLFQTVDITDLLALIVDYAEDVHKQHGFNLNILPFVIKSLVNTLNLMPRITHNEEIDLEVSLNTQKFGYISPTLNNVGADTIIQLARSLNDIQQRAEDYKLLPRDFKGSKFILYDNRSFNIRASTPVLDINHILGISVHGINEKLVPQDSNIIIAKTIELSLSFDQNHVLFEVASLVLDKIKTQLEEPQNLLQNF